MMTLKALFLCVCLAFAAVCPAFSQGAPFILREDDVSVFGALGTFAHTTCSGENCIHPLAVTEFHGASFDALARAKTVKFKEGKPAEETVFAADGSVLNTVSYTYTEAGLLLEARGADSSGALKWAYRYEYGEEGKLLRETSFTFADGQERLEGATALYYDGSGRLTKRDTLAADGAVTLTETFLYDESGRLTEKNSHYGDGILLKRETCEYAAADSEKVPQGEAARVRHYDSNGLYETILFEYKDGRISATLRYGSDSVLKDSETFNYIEGKLARRATFNSEGAPIAEHSFVFDWSGSMIMERNASGITVWDFTYPEQDFDGAR